MAAGRHALPAGLLDDVLTYLQVPAEDETIRTRIANLIAAGMSYIDGKIGISADYTADNEARSLLFDYVRYARDGASDVFEQNYAHLIIAARNEIRIEEMTE